MAFKIGFCNIRLNAEAAIGIESGKLFVADEYVRSLWQPTTWRSTSKKRCNAKNVLKNCAPRFELMLRILTRDSFSNADFETFLKIPFTVASYCHCAESGVIYKLQDGIIYALAYGHIHEPNPGPSLYLYIICARSACYKRYHLDEVRAQMPNFMVSDESCAKMPNFMQPERYERNKFKLCTKCVGSTLVVVRKERDNVKLILYTRKIGERNSHSDHLVYVSQINVNLATTKGSWIACGKLLAPCCASRMNICEVNPCVTPLRFNKDGWPVVWCFIIHYGTELVTCDYENNYASDELDTFPIYLDGHNYDEFIFTPNVKGVNEAGYSNVSFVVELKGGASKNVGKYAHFFIFDVVYEEEEYILQLKHKSREITEREYLPMYADIETLPKNASTQLFGNTVVKIRSHIIGVYDMQPTSLLDVALGALQKCHGFESEQLGSVDKEKRTMYIQRNGISFKGAMKRYART